MINLAALEDDARALTRRLQASVIPGAWRPSPVEAEAVRLREALLSIPGVLSHFRHTCLAAGRQNFPDSPLHKQQYLQWDRLPTIRERVRAPVVILRQLWRLSRVRTVTADDLTDRGVGHPLRIWLPWLLPSGAITWVPTSEAQIRFVYYRTRLEALASPLGTVLEIGGGYGGLAVELLRRCAVTRYVLVELPDALPLAWFYLRACVDDAVDLACTRAELHASTARVLLVAPWLLPEVTIQPDLVLNTASFQHMDAENLRFYCAQIARLRPEWMYLVNRNTIRHPTDVPIDQYPIPAWLQLVDDRPWPLARTLRERTYQRQEGA